MEFGSSFTRAYKQFVHCIFAYISYPRRCANAVTFHQQADDQGAGFGVKLVHGIHIAIKPNAVKHIGQFEPKKHTNALLPIGKKKLASLWC